jgi:hypothetical protein
VGTPIPSSRLAALAGMGSVDHGTCPAPHFFTRHISATHRAVFRGYAFAYFKLAQIEAIPKHEAQHCLRSATGLARELFKAALLRGGKCQRSHAAPSSGDQHEKLYVRTPSAAIMAPMKSAAPMSALSRAAIPPPSVCFSSITALTAQPLT